MKHYKALLAIALCSLGLTSCGVAGGAIGTNLVGNMLTGQGTTAPEREIPNTNNTTTGLFGNLLSSFIGGSQVTAKELVGKWQYQGVACIFESENILARVGGVVAASKLEEQLDTKLATVGIKAGSSTFTFNKDNTYTVVIGGREISGQYQIDAKTNKIDMSYLAGLGQMSATLGRSGQNVTLLFEADKLMTLANTIAKVSGSNSTAGSISSLLNNYSGMQIGLKLAR